jgi:sensor histidine kinase regulating citrate/malate metabolism
LLCCKLFHPIINQSFTENGYDNWKNDNVKIQNHERSVNCLDTIKAILYIQKYSRVDRELIKQLNKEKYYWTQVLQRVILVVTFLSEKD